MVDPSPRRLRRPPRVISSDEAWPAVNRECETCVEQHELLDPDDPDKGCKGKILFM